MTVALISASSHVTEAILLHIITGDSSNGQPSSCKKDGSDHDQLPVMYWYKLAALKYVCSLDILYYTVHLIVQGVDTESGTKHGFSSQLPVPRSISKIYHLFVGLSRRMRLCKSQTDFNSHHKVSWG